MKFSHCLLATACCWMSFSAAALEISVENETDAQATLAFSYLNAKTGKWQVEGWYNVASHSRAVVNLDTDNSLYYLYAEFSNGKKIEGGEGAVELGVQDRSFSYLQEQPLKKSARQVSFLRARGNGNRATIRVR